MFCEIDKFSITGKISCKHFACGIANTVSRIGRSVRVASVRRLGHPDADEASAHRFGCEPHDWRAALRVCKFALREIQPFAGNRLVHGIVAAQPILHAKGFCIGFGPCDAHSLDRLRRAKINHDPLGMAQITLACKSRRQIGIALPVSRCVAVRQARITVRSATVAGIAAVRQRVAVRNTQRVFGLGASREIAALLFGVAPRTIGIPMPRGNGQFSVLAVGDGTPAGGKRCFDGFRVENFFELSGGQNIERSPEREVRIERNSFALGNVHAHGLCGGSNCDRQKRRKRKQAANQQQPHSRLGKSFYD